MRVVRVVCACSSVRVGVAKTPGSSRSARYPYCLHALACHKTNPKIVTNSSLNSLGLIICCAVHDVCVTDYM